MKAQRGLHIGSVGRLRHGGAVFLPIVLAVAPAILFALILEPVPALVIPVILTTLPAIHSNIWYRRIMTLLVSVPLAGFCFISLASVGFYFVPSLLAVVVVAWQSWTTNEVTTLAVL